MAGMPRPHFVLLLMCACAVVNILFYTLTAGDTPYRSHRPTPKFIDIDEDSGKVEPATNPSLVSEDSTDGHVGDRAKSGWRRLQNSPKLDNGDMNHNEMPHRYEFPINNVNACAVAENDTDKSLGLVVVVISGINNFLRRHAIRNTWGSVVRDVHSSLIFLVGEDKSSKTIQRQVLKESQLYGDIIQVDILDSYRNLSSKSMAMLQWLDTYCRNAKFYLKSDDDMYINIENALKALKTSSPRRFFMCYVFRRAEPIRNPNSKWFTSLQEFPSRYFPTYCSGTAYAFPSSIVSELYKAGLTTRLVTMEDVYITGIVANKINSIHVHHAGFWYLKRKATGCEYKNAISGHEVTTQEMFVIFSQLHEDFDCDRNINYIKEGLTDVPYAPYRYDKTK